MSSGAVRSEISIEGPGQSLRPDAPAPGRPYLARPLVGERQLAVVVYHYVGDAERKRYPRINTVPVDQFANQVRALAERYEMATLESALAFLDGRYAPSRSLCLLTFDDGLKGHHRDVLPVLSAAGVQGLFFATTGCLEGRVPGVHKNHCLMSVLDFPRYQAELVAQVRDRAPGLPLDVDDDLARRAYPWDSDEVGRFKYLLNYGLPVELRNAVLDALFVQFVGDEREVARELYMDREELREMQAAGMLIGGHAHRHVPLTALDGAALRRELDTCVALLRAGLHDQTLWPFSYPYGYCDDASARAVRDATFDCSFALDGGPNQPGHDRYRIRRIDTKDILF